MAWNEEKAVRAREELYGQTALRSSFMQGMRSDPDRAARALPHAKDKGIPLDMAERNLDDLEEQRRFNDIDFGRIQRDTPKLGQWIQDVDNARLAHDDLTFLSAIHKSVGRGFSVGLESIPDLTANTYEAVKYATGFPKGSDQPVTARSERPDPEKAQPSFGSYGQAIKEGQGVLQDVGNVTRKVFEDVGQGIASSTPSLGLSLAGGLAGTQVAPGIGTAVGTIGGAYLGSSSQVIGEFYRELENAAAEYNTDPLNTDKITYQTLARESLKWGAALAAPDALVPGRAGGRVVNATVQTSIKEQAIAAMQDAAKAETLKRVGKEVAQDTVVEGVTEGVQQAGQVTGVALNVDGEIVNAENAMQVVEATLSGAVGGAGMSTISQGAAGTINVSKEILQANESRNYLEQVKTELANPEGKLTKRSKEATRDYLNQITGDADIYIDGEAVETLYQSLTPEQQQSIESAIPSFAQDLSTAIEANGDIVLNRADYFTYIQPLDTESWLDQNARMIPEHFSMSDIAEYDSIMQEIADVVTDVQDLQDGEIVQNRVYEQLIQRVGELPSPTGKVDVARMVSENPRAFYETILERAGGDERVQSILNRLVRDVTIRRQLPERVQNVLQADNFDLMIDRVRNRQNDLAKAQKRQESRDLFGKKGKRGARAVNKGPKPVMNYLISAGKVRTGSTAAKSLAEIDITPKRYPRLFSKAGTVSALDNIPLSEVNTGLPEGLQGTAVSEDSTYVDQQWLIDQINDEDFGRGQATPEQFEKEQQEEYLDDLENAIQMAGLDTDASNQEIKMALDRLRDEQKAFDGAIDDLPADIDDVVYPDMTPEEKGVLSELEKEHDSPLEFSPKDKPEPIKPEDKIVDFGEKIEGAKKELWSSYVNDLSDALPEDAADIKLSKVFPAPDYDALIAQGVDTKRLAAVKAIRDSIPSKPRKAWKLKHWVSQLEQLRELAADVLGEGKTFEKFVEEGKKLSQTATARKAGLTSFFERMELYSDLGYPAFLKASQWDVRPAEYSRYMGVDYKPAKLLWGVSKNGGFGEAFSTREAAVDYLRKRLEVEPTKEAKQTKLDVYQKTKTGEILIGKKVASGKFLDLKGGFTSAKEAHEYLKNNQKPLLVLLEKVKKIAPVRDEKNRPRVGEDYRMGENVTPEKFSNEFGFRGVQFGNYVEQKKRVDDLNNSYDALLDMASIIGVGSKALSLNGTLGLAFGARGKGAAGSDGVVAAAHYESDHVVINLTKKEGAGSLGHEWWHALDNYFGVKKGGKDFLTQNTSIRKYNRDGTLVTEHTVREEVSNAFKGVMDAIKATGIEKRSVELDKKRTKSYWSTPIEMSARSFESYLIYKAKEKGEANDYLANIVKEDTWKALMEGEDMFPYPNESEMSEHIAPAFDQLFSVLETRETEKGIEFFQRAPEFDTKAFKNWFKDSQIVDEEGEPMVVYHGTDQDIQAFDRSKLKNGASKFGFWFTNDQDFAENFGETQMPVYLSMQNPKRISLDKWNSIRDDHWEDGEWFENWSLELQKQGFDGLIVEGQKQKIGRFDVQEPHVYAVFDPTQIKSVDNRGTFDPADVRTLYQDNARGSIQFMPTGEAVINLFEKEDLSTLMHELGHLYWKAMTEIASLDEAPAQIASDVDVIRKWVGAKPLAESSEALTVDQEEKIADGFLAYIREGKAPSAELQSAFSRMKAWLLRIYRGVRDTLPSINKDVEAVFDRMLATDDAIEAVSKEQVFSLDKAIIGLLTKSDADRMQKKMDRAIEDAKNRLYKKALRQVEARETKAYKQARAALEKEISEMVETERVYRSMTAIKDAGGLSRKALVKGWGKEVIPYLSGHGGLVAKSGGVDPAAVSGIVGYTNSQEMVSELMNAPRKKDRIRDLVDEEMMSRYGDMLNDGTIEREAVEQMHNELREQVIVMEYQMLFDLAGTPAPTKEAIKAKAIQIMAETKVKDIIPNRRLRAQNKAQFEYGKALGQKNYAVAARAKAQQLLNHHLYRMSLEARDKMDKKMKGWRKVLGKSDEQIAKNQSVTQRSDGTFSAGPDLDYVYAARAVLAKYGIGKFSYDFETFFNNLRRDDPDVADTLLQAYTMLTEGAPDWQARKPDSRGISVRTPPYKTMGYADFQALSDAVDNLIEVGRNQKFITINGKRVAKQQAIDDMSDILAGHKQANMPGVSDHWTIKDKARRSLWGFKAATARVQSWVKNMDKGYTGSFHDYIWNPVQDGINAYRDQRKEMMDNIVTLLEPHKDRLHGEPIAAEELVSTIDGQAYTFENKAELVGMLAHTGNGFEPGSNGYKLLMGMGWARFDEDGELDTSAFDSFRDRMYSEGIITKEDMDLVQSLWDMAESMKPQVWKAHKDMYGFYPDSVTHVPFMTPFGEYKGGYWPAVVDKTKSRDAAMRENQRIAENENNVTAFPTTGRGAAKSRVDHYSAPLELSLRLLPNHIDWAMRFVHIEPAVKDVAKLMLNKEFSTELERVAPGSVDELIMPWLQRVARQTTDKPVQERFWKDSNAVAGWARRSTGVMIMAGNVINVAMQFTGIGPLIYKVGGRDFARAFIQWSKSPAELTETVNEASAVMRHAQATFLDEDYQKKVQRLIEGTSLRKNMEDISQDYGYIGQKVAQNMINNIGWIAAYNQALSGKAKGIEAGNDEQAVRYADTVISETQGLNNPENIANVEAQTAMGKLFMMFYSYFNNQGNFIASEVRGISREKSGVGAKAASAFYLYLMVYMFPSFLADLIGATLRGDLPEDDDEDGTALDEWFNFYLLSQVRYVAASVPYAGQAFNYAIAKFTPQTFDDQISGSPVLSTAEKAISAPFSIWNAVFNEGDRSKAVGDTLTLIGAIPGVGLTAPAGFAMRPAKYAADVSEGESVADDIGDIIQGVSSGRAPDEE